MVKIYDHTQQQSSSRVAMFSWFPDAMICNYVTWVCHLMLIYCTTRFNSEHKQI